MNNVTPLHNYINIELMEQKTQTESGILLTETAVGRAKWAKVLAVGAGVPDMTGFKFRPAMEEGDIVYMFPHAWEECDLTDLGGSHSYFVSEGDILMIVDETKEIGVRPQGSWIIVKLVKNPEKKTAGGIYLSDTTLEKQRPQLAKVIATGPGLRTPGAQVGAAMDTVFSVLCDMKLLTEEQKAYHVFKHYCENNVSVVPPTVHEGDTILIRKDAVISIDFSDIYPDKEDYYLLAEGDVYGIINGSIEEDSTESHEDSADYKNQRANVEAFSSIKVYR